MEEGTSLPPVLFLTGEDEDDDEDEEYIQSPQAASGEDDYDEGPAAAGGVLGCVVEEDEEAIAHRTRARYRVEDIDWAALDALLMQEWHEEEEAAASGADEADPALEEYIHFLSSLQHVDHAALATEAAGESGARGGGEEEEEEEEEEDNDPDYRESESNDGESHALRASSSSSSSSSSSWWCDYEERRDDRAVRISQKELEALLAQAREDGSKDADHRRALVPILPAWPPLSSGGHHDVVGPFTAAQYEELRTQLAQHTQLLAQVCALALSGPAHLRPFAQPTISLLVQLRCLRDQRGGSGQRAQSWSPQGTAASRTTAPPPSPPLSPRARQAGVLTRRMAMRQRACAHTETSADRGEEPRLPALFDLPALRVLPRLEAALAQLVPAATPPPPSPAGGDADDAPPPRVGGAGPPLAGRDEGLSLVHARVQSLLAPTPPQFDPALALAFPLHSSRRLFTPAEDRLLAIGLERFGRRGLAQVHEQYLSTKTFNQVHNRYKHLTLASTTWNPVKAVRAGWQWVEGAQLSGDEQLLVREGIAAYGYQWEQISRHLLPHRAPARLQKLWTDLHASPDPSSLLSPSPVPLPPCGPLSRGDQGAPTYIVYCPMGLVPTISMAGHLPAMAPCGGDDPRGAPPPPPPPLPPVAVVLPSVHRQPATSRQLPARGAVMAAAAATSSRAKRRRVEGSGAEVPSRLPCPVAIEQPPPQHFDQEELSDSDSEEVDDEAEAPPALPALPSSSPSSQTSLASLLPADMFETVCLSDSGSDSEDDWPDSDPESHSAYDHYAAAGSGAGGAGGGASSLSPRGSVDVIVQGPLSPDVRPWTRDEDKWLLERIRAEATGPRGVPVTPQQQQHRHHHQQSGHSVPRELAVRSPAEVARRRHYLLALLDHAAS